MKRLTAVAALLLYACAGPDPDAPGDDDDDDDDVITNAGDDDDTVGDDDDTTPGDEGFQGYGAVTEGALSSPDGFETYHVTSLADDGSEGTLRAAVSEPNRHIVFDVGGTITLDSRLTLEQDYITIDGLSAPEPGITITHRVGEYHGFIIDGQHRDTHDLILQGLRFRGVYDVDPVHVVGRAIFTADGDCGSAQCSGGIRRLIIDRVTLAWASDKFSLWGLVRDVTLSNSFFHGSDKALLVSFYGEPYDLIKERISIHHNVFTENAERNPQIVAWVTDLDYRNNIVHGWQWYGMRIKSVDVGDRGEESVDANIVNNVFHDNGYSEGLGLVFLEDGVSDCHAQGDFVDTSSMGELWVDGNTFSAETCDSYSTVTARRVVPPEALVATHPPADLCALMTPTVGAPYRTAEEDGWITQVQTDLNCL